jgi:hypothetical protein
MAQGFIYCIHDFVIAGKSASNSLAKGQGS